MTFKASQTRVFSNKSGSLLAVQAGLVQDSAFATSPTAVCIALIDCSTWLIYSPNRASPLMREVTAR